MIGYFIYVVAHFFTPINPLVKSATNIPKLKGDSLTKYVYLSFDDGPLPGTNNCITICEQQKVMATFFEVAFHQSRNSYGKRIYNRIRANATLFEIANHSFSHAFYGDYLEYYHHPDSALADFKKAAGILNTNNNLTRLPGNNAWKTKNISKASGLVRPLVRKLDSVGMNVVGWDMEWRFNPLGKPITSPEKMAFIADSLFKHNHTKTKNHLVILMHDHEFRASADSSKLVTLIRYLQRDPNIQFRKLSTYPGLKNRIN